MKTNEILRAQIFDIIKKQMMSNDPPETKQTFERLNRLGYSEQDAKMYIGQCVAVELFNLLKYKKPFDEHRYITNLKKLPKEPFD